MGGALLLADLAAAQEPRAHPDDLTGWYVGFRAIVGASDEDTGFEVLPPGTISVGEDSYDPQENFGAGIAIGFRSEIHNLPVRTELSGSWMYRHDADMRVLSGAGTAMYQNDLAIWDARLSVLADVIQFSWGSFYFGGGLGVAFLDSAVQIEGTQTSADNEDWRFSPSVQAGLVINDVFKRVDIEIGYRFRWLGNTESGAFPTGEQLTYDDANIHEVSIGVIVPIGR